MAVSLGHTSTHRSNNSASTSATFAHDCTGDDQLIVSINLRGNPGTVSATYNGVSMTKIVDNVANSLYSYLSVFKLASPTTGSNNIVISWSNSVRWSAGGASFSGVDSVSTPNLYTGNGATATGSETLTTGDMAMGFFAVPDILSRISVSSGTEMFEIDETVGGSWASLGNAYNTGSGSVAVTYAYTGSDTWEFATVKLTQSAAAGSNSNLLLLGIG